MINNIQLISQELDFLKQSFYHLWGLEIYLEWNSCPLHTELNLSPPVSETRSVNEAIRVWLKYTGFLRSVEATGRSEQEEIQVNRILL